MFDHVARSVRNLSRGHARVVSETLAHSDILVLLLPVP
jgi:hypothetical protein